MFIVGFCSLLRLSQQLYKIFIMFLLNNINININKYFI
jgi:hypothetical protein